MSGITTTTDRIRFGCCGSMISPNSDPVGCEIIEELAVLGYDYIELSMRDLVLLSESELESLISRLRRAGIACEACNNFFPPKIRLTGPTFDLPAALRYAQKAFFIAAQLGVSVIIFGSSGARNIPDGFSPEAAWAQLRTLLRELGPVAQQYDVTIAIEHLNRGESNILNTVHQAWQMAQEVAHPHVRLLVDAYHVRMENENSGIVADVAPAIAHVHVAEGTDRVFPSGQDASLAEFFARLRSVRYRGRCSIEGYARDFSTDAARALRVCRDLAAGVT